MTQIVLASASPRRLELLRELGIEPVVRPADVDETPHDEEAPVALVTRLSAAKATTVERGADDLVVAADTVVSVDSAVLGKPIDEADAAAMLGRLSGTTHRVITGVHLCRGDDERSGADVTEISFRTLSAAEIAAYVATGEPMDKAGAFAIQGAAADFVVSMVGSHTNVVGLPLDLVVRLASELGVPLARPHP